MIKIHKKLWYVCTKSEYKNEALAYMTHYAEDEAFDKRVATGTSWAGFDYKQRDVSAGVVVDNVPTSGFYIGDSVSRWSTSNKLFRVVDPRGFMVEVPTGNISMLLHHTTVTNGFVQSECVWGREGNNHILLPVNSEPYLETLDKMDVLANKLISVKELKRGDWVKFFDDKNEYYYVGKVKVTWKVTPYNSEYLSWGNRKQVYGEPKIVKDSKWIDVFIYNAYGNYWYSSTPSKPKIIEIIRNEKIENDNLPKNLGLYCPERVQNQVYSRGDWHFSECEFVDVEYK